VSVLRNFERRLEGLVEGLFAKAFRTGLQPVELARRLLREMEAGQTVGVRGVWVPNHYTFRLSHEDRDRFANAEDAIVQELRQVVRENARERGWELVGPPKIDFETDEKLGRGEFRCEAELVAGPDTGPSGQLPPVGAGPREAELVLLKDGKRFPLDGGTVTIGRLPECQIIIEDPGISRKHAEISRTAEGFVVRDLGSTNGTMVNDAPVSGGRRLEEGDRITIGRSVLEFRGR
jgi:hypothetical protein